MNWLQSGARTSRKIRLRFLKSLAVPGALLRQTVGQDQVTWKITSRNAPAPSNPDRAHWTDDIVRDALSAGILEPIDKASLCLSAAGKMTLRRALSGGDYASQHRHQQSMRLQKSSAVDGKTPAQTVTVNLNESPLARLAVRRTKTGAPLLDPEEVRAGERLRADYTFAAMMPEMQPGWRTESNHGAGSNRTGRDLTDDVLAARKRVTRALSGLQPDLAGVLVDICCHLKGLEVVESERCWPSRSAKIVLKIALSALALNYREGHPQARS